MRRWRGIWASGVAAAVMAATPAAAQEAGATQYDAAFYEAFRPQTALDILARTPGFTLDDGEDGVDLRGFGAGAGNVLINGQRPTVKSGGITSVLSRIAATRVIRVELLRGAATAEAQGQALVANLVLTESGGGSGNIALELRRAPGDMITPLVEASYALQAGNWDLSLGGVAFYEQNPLHSRFRYFDAAGQATGEASGGLDHREHGLTLNASATRPLGGGTLTINASFEGENERFDQNLPLAAGTATASRVTGTERERGGELALDWLRGIGGGWSAKLVSLARLADERFAGEELAPFAAGFSQHGTATELVGRASLSRESEHWLRPEFSAELAWNRLDSALTQTEDGVPIDLAGANTIVSELRGEARASLTAQVLPTLRLETALAHERSRISVQAERDDARYLAFWKPSAALVWDASTAIQARLGWERSVGQLDFASFAASGDIINDRPISGNAELRPEITSGWSLRLDYRFGTGGALSLEGKRQTIGDALAYVPLESGGEALLNAGSVSLWQLAGEATLPLDFALAGAQLTASASTTSARRDDPVTGERRDDGRSYDAFDLGFRHDVAPLNSAWGFSVEWLWGEREWFTAETVAHSFRHYLVAFVETSAISGFKTTLTFSGITGDRAYRQRRFFDPDVAGAFSGSEFREERRGAYVNLKMARQF